MAEQLPITTASNQQYGQRLAQQRAQEAVPMGTPPTSVPSPIRKKPRIAPGSLTPLTAPTARPDEPITAGANFGPGPTALGAGIPMMPSQGTMAVDELRQIAQIFPTDDLLDLLDTYGNEL
jgi:hypothetical protein